MRPVLCILPLITLVVVLGTPAYAQTTHEIHILSGSSDPNSSRFWYNSAAGTISDEITVFTGDSILWINSDTQPHTVTSVTQSGQEDGLFDSGTMGIAGQYSRQFTEVGDFYYYSAPHPWMAGVIHVLQNPGSVQSLDHVAFGDGPDGQGYTVRYILDASLDGAVTVDPDTDTLTFTIQEDAHAEQMTLVLPLELIDEPNAVWVDDVMTDFTADANELETALTIPLEAGAQEIRVMGSHVIPEFGFMAPLVLVMGIVSVLFLTRSRLPALLQTRA